MIVFNAQEIRLSEEVVWTRSMIIMVSSGFEPTPRITLWSGSLLESKRATERVSSTPSVSRSTQTFRNKLELPTVILLVDTYGQGNLGGRSYLIALQTEVAATYIKEIKKRD